VIADLIYQALLTYPKMVHGHSLRNKHLGLNKNAVLFKSHVGPESFNKKCSYLQEFTDK